MPCVKVSMLTWQVGSVTSCMSRRLDCSVFSWALMRSIECSNLAFCASAIYKNKKTNKNLNKWEKQKHMKKHSQIYKQLYIASRFNECKSLLPQADPTPIYEAECLANCGSDTWNHHLDTCAPISVVLEEVNVTSQSTASVH